MQIDNNIPIPDVARSRRGSSAKAKGKSGEREALINLVMCMQQVERELGMFDEHAQSHKVQRNLQQTIAGGHDIVGIPALCIEVKRQETLQVEQWWKQCVDQASREGQGNLPVLLYRQNRQGWKVRTFMQLYHPTYDLGSWIVSECDLSEFLTFYAKLYRNWLLTARQDRS